MTWRRKKSRFILPTFFLLFMNKWSQFSVDELSVIDLALGTAEIEHCDLDLPLIEQLHQEIKEELAKRE